MNREVIVSKTGWYTHMHKGAWSVKSPAILSQITTYWFIKRDKNLPLPLQSTPESNNGQVRMIFNGDSKSAHFKMRLDATFSVSGESPDSPAYLKDLNFAVDSRDFY